MTKQVVCAVEDLPDGGRVIVELGGHSIGVFNVGGRYFAVRNRCPHQAGPLCLGARAGELTSSGPGDYAYDEDRYILRCPWHQWEFDMRSGRSSFDPNRVRVRAYPAEVEDGEAIRARYEADGTAGDPVTAASPATGRVPGPYRAETYPVTVEGRYVVVSLSRGGKREKRTADQA